MTFRWDEWGWERRRRALAQCSPRRPDSVAISKKYSGYCRSYFNPKALWGFVRSVCLGYGLGGSSLQGCFQGCALPVSTLLFYHYYPNCIPETWQQSISGPEVTKDKSKKRHCFSPLSQGLCRLCYKSIHQSSHVVLFKTTSPV